MTYPAISIRQMWAALIVLGIKDVENRGQSWNYTHTGLTLVHAPKVVDFPARDVECFLGAHETVRRKPEWVITGYDSKKWATKEGYCRKPMPFTDRRYAVTLDIEWSQGLQEYCPAWEAKESE